MNERTNGGGGVNDEQTVRTYIHAMTAAMLRPAHTRKDKGKGKDVHW